MSGGLSQRLVPTPTKSSVPASAIVPTGIKQEPGSSGSCQPRWARASLLWRGTLLSRRQGANTCPSLANRRLMPSRRRRKSGSPTSRSRSTPSCCTCETRGPKWWPSAKWKRAPPSTKYLAKGWVCPIIWPVVKDDLWRRQVRRRF